MGFAQGDYNITFKDIFERIPEESILEYYTGISQVPCVTNSPLRVDKNPSFGITYTDKGLFFKDFGTNATYNLIGVLLELLSLDNCKDLKKRILTDFDLDDKIISIINENSNKARTKRSKRRIKTGQKLQVRVSHWEKHDIEYWEQYGITLKWLKFGKVYPISHFMIGESVYKAQKHAYCYVEHKDNITTLKIYQPFSEKFKWLNNHDSSVWDLWTQAIDHKSDELIITSSRKDALCLWANIGIPAVSLQAEGYLPKTQVIEELKTKFSTIYCLYDNDFDKEKNHGRLYGKALSSTFGLKQIEIPSELEAKDPSDLFVKYGKTKFQEIINTILKNK